jgi:hypothetical protein
VLHGGLFIDKTVIHPDSIENGLLNDYKNIVLHEVRYDNSGRLIGDITVYYNDDTHQDYTVDLRYIPELDNLTDVSKGASVEDNSSEKDNLTQAKEKVGVTPNMEKYWDALSDEAKLALGNGDTITIKGIEITADNFSTSERILKMAMRNGKIESNIKAMEKKSSVVLEKEREREARKWLAKNLPSLNSEERTQFVDKLLRGGSEMWGNYRNGVIEILNGAPRGTVYHEAFHYVMDMLISDTEKERILGIAKEAYNTNDTWEAEERLANDFRRYVMDENATGIIGKLKRWFRSLKDKITRHNRIKDTTVNQLFWQINNGKFANKSLIADRASRNNQQMLREIRNVQIKRLDWNNLAESTREAIEESGLTKEAYDKMCLEEKEQYVKCRG